MPPSNPPAGQFNDAAYHLVQLRKILEDTNGQGKAPEANTEKKQLQLACDTCGRELEEVRDGTGQCFAIGGACTAPCCLGKAG